MRDFEAYYAAGTVWDAGGNPYGQQIWPAERSLHGAASHPYEALPFAGPPALLPVAGALARLPFAQANLVWRALLACAVAALVLLALHLTGLRADSAAYVLTASAALGFGPLTGAFALGQIALPAFALAATGVRRPAAIFFAWLQPNIALSASALRYFVPSCIVFAAACIAVAGIGGAVTYLHLLRSHALAEQFSLIQTTPSAIAYGLGVPDRLAAGAGILAAIAASIVFAARVVPIRDTIARFCATCALVPFAAPFFHEHDLLVTFVPAFVLAQRVREPAFPWVLAAAMFCAVDWLGLAQRPEASLQALLLAAAFAAALIGLRMEIRIGWIGVAAAVLALVAIAAWATASQPAPVWPDAMRPLPQDPSGMDLAAAWHMELAAAGMFTRNAFWAVLRCAPLLGSAGLVYAALNVDVHHVVELRDRVGVEVL